MEMKTDLIKKLQPKIDKAIELIRKAAREKQVIFVRHHNDCDGYCAALALDDFIYKSILDGQQKEKDVFYHYKRIPSQTPFYSYEDSTKDISFIYNSIVSRNKRPLMIVLDNGSSEEDYEGLKRLKIFGFHIIVIDHHPTYDKIDEIVDVHINPHLVEKNPIISAGTLCSEIAKGVDKKNESLYDYISCVSAISDHAEGEEYKISLTNLKEPYEKLRIIGESIDYELTQTGFLDPWTMVRELLLDELGLKEKLLEEYSKEIGKRLTTSLNTSLRYAKTEERKGKMITFLDVGSTSHKKDYPRMGKAVGLLHRHIENKNKGKECITFGYMDDLISIRATDDSAMDVNILIRDLDKAFPYAKVEGGGHAHAGSIRFIMAAKEEILDFIRKRY